MARRPIALRIRGPATPSYTKRCAPISCTGCRPCTSRRRTPRAAEPLISTNPVSMHRRSGAAHTTEIPMGVRHPRFATWHPYGSAPAAEAVSDEMSTAWRSFAARGDPGWPAYDPGEQLTRVFERRLQGDAVSRTSIATDLGGLPVRPIRPAAPLAAGPRVHLRVSAGWCRCAAIAVPSRAAPQ